MRAVIVEVVAPCRHQIAGMSQAVEEVLAQKLVPHPAVKALHEAVLYGFSRRDVVPFDLAVSLPLQDRVRGQFRAIVADVSEDLVSFVNVGMWTSVDAFMDAVGRYMVEGRSIKEDFEAAPRRRAVLTPKHWRIGSDMLPTAASEGVKP